MAQHKIDIEDALWAKTRIRAFEEGTTATAIVNAALERYLAIPKVSPKRAAPVSSDAAPRSAPPPTEGDFTLEHAADGTQVITPHPKEDPWQDLATKPKLISTPEEAAQVAQSLPSFRPAPKPSSRSSRTRSRSKSRTDPQEP